MKILSKEFEHGGYIPKKFSCCGENISPKLKFENIHTKAKSLVLIMDDPDVPDILRKDRNFDHWILFNIPSQIKEIKENSFEGVRGINTRKTLDYIGPCPPDTIHRYFFRLYALSEYLDLTEGANKEEVYEAMESKILDKAIFVGLFEQTADKKTLNLR